MNTLTGLRRYSPRQLLLLGLLVLLPFERLPSYHAAGVNIRLSLLAGLLLVAASLPALWRSRRQLASPPWIWLLGYLGVGCLATLLALSHSRSLKVLVFSGFVMALAWSVSDVVCGNLSRRAILYALLGGATATLLFGLYQFFGDLAGLSTHLTGLRQAYTKEVFGFPRIQSTGLEPLYYADYLLVPAAVTLMFGLYKKWQYLGLSTFIMTVIWLTVSRGAYYGLIAILAGVIALALLCKRYWQAAAVVGSVILSVALAVGLIALGSHFNQGPGHTSASSNLKAFEHQSTNTDTGESVEGRTFSRNYALQLFKHHPVVGVGLGNYGIYAARNYPERYPNTSGIVNNEPLEILAESGVLGFGAIVGFVVALALMVGRRLKPSLPLNQPDDNLVWVAALSLALIGIAIQYQAFSTLYIIHIWTAIGLLVGFVASGRTAKSSHAN